MSAAYIQVHLRQDFLMEANTKKKASMIRKYHNDTLQPYPQHHEVEPKNTNSHKTSGRQLK